MDVMSRRTIEHAREVCAVVSLHLLRIAASMSASASCLNLHAHAHECCSRTQRLLWQVETSFATLRALLEKVVP